MKKEGLCLNFQFSFREFKTCIYNFEGHTDHHKVLFEICIEDP